MLPGAPHLPLQQSISETRRLEIPARFSFISFEFAALNFRAPEKNQYAFKLHGFDQDWRKAGPERRATYTNLDPGRYRFQVIASNNEGVWNKAGTVLELIVVPPWSHPARESLEEIRKSSQRAADLCRHMLAYAGKGRFVLEPVDLNTLLQETMDLVQSSISKKAVLQLKGAAILPKFSGDSGQIRQVATNLIMNASEALGDNEGFIQISTGAGNHPASLFAGG